MAGLQEKSPLLARLLPARQATIGTVATELLGIRLRSAGPLLTIIGTPPICVFQMEEWLKSDQLPKNLLIRARKKFLYIMYLIRKVGNRTEGMGLKIMKFHGIQHMVDDMFHHGAAINFDTGSDEKGHKPTKKAAKVTQKRKDLFDEQCSKRLSEMHVLELAMAEIFHKGGRPLWEYYTPIPQESQELPRYHPRKNTLWGARFGSIRKEDGSYGLEQLSRDVMNNDKRKTEQDLIDFFGELAQKVTEYLPSLALRTTYTDGDGVIFRGASYHLGRVWRDWVLIDWGGDHRKQPGKIWGFVDLCGLPEDNDVQCGGLSGIIPGLYAIVENAKYEKPKERGARQSEIFVPISTEVARMERGRVVKFRFYLALVEDFVEPAAVVPDIGGAGNAYFLVKKREEWRDDFARWLRRPHEDWEDFDEYDGKDYESGSDDSESD